MKNNSNSIEELSFLKSCNFFYLNYRQVYFHLNYRLLTHYFNVQMKLNEHILRFHSEVHVFLAPKKLSQIFNEFFSFAIC